MKPITKPATKSNASKLILAVNVVGTQRELARRLAAACGKPVTAHHIRNWLYRDKAVPPEYCPATEKISRGAVTRRDLRPDDHHLIWPKEEAAPKQHHEAGAPGAMPGMLLQP